MFASPPEQTMEWSDSSVEGAARFLRKVWRAINNLAEVSKTQNLSLDKTALSAQRKELRRQLHQTFSKVSDDYARRYSFNTAIAAQMELLNATQALHDKDEQALALKYEVYKGMLLMLSPIVPHITQALWEILGEQGLIIDAGWPVVDESALVQDSFELVVQVNGKVRAKMEVAAGVTDDEIKAQAQQLDNVQKFINEKTIRKIIVVPKRLVNIVAN